MVSNKTLKQMRLCRWLGRMRHIVYYVAEHQVHYTPKLFCSLLKACVSIRHSKVTINIHGGAGYIVLSITQFEGLRLMRCSQRAFTKLYHAAR